MTFPSNVDADPDPTTQIPWPARATRRRASTINHPGFIPQPSSQDDDSSATGVKTNNIPAKDDEVVQRRMTTWDLVKLSISMAGAQVAWTVELGYAVIFCISETLLIDVLCRYGTPFLLSLGLSEQLTSLVWLAGPISGLIAQPVIGTSFHSNHRHDI